MINIRIYGCPDKLERSRLRCAAMFYIDELLPKKRKLDIRIFLKKGLLKEEKMSGCCSADDFGVNKRHFDFTIHIEHSLNLKDRLSILAHEMTHVKQYATGQLLYDARAPEISIWEGIRYDDNKIAYEDQPWEKDASKHEDVLLKRFLKTVDWL